MQKDSLNVQNSTLELDDPDDEKYDDGNTMSIRELKQRQWRRLSGSTQKKDGKAHDPKKAHHDTTNEDIGLFMLICMLCGQILKQVAGKTGVPYTSLITIFGIILGVE